MPLFERDVRLSLIIRRRAEEFRPGVQHAADVACLGHEGGGGGNALASRL
jgi:hypothetical protein